MKLLDRIFGRPAKSAETEVGLYVAQNFHTEIGTFYYSDRYPKPYGFYRVTREDKAEGYPEGSVQVWGVLVLPITLARCTGLQIARMLNERRCRCEPEIDTIKEFHNEPLEELKASEAKRRSQK